MVEAPRYLLPVAVLLATMSDASATVTLRAQLDALPQGWDGAGIAELALVQGQLQRCTIRTLDGQLVLQQDAAFHLLERSGELAWTLHAPAPDDPHQGPQRQTLHHPEPRRWTVTTPLSATVLARLPLRDKQVLLLLQSRKAPEEMARLLGLPLPQVEQCLLALAARQLIAQTDEPDKDASFIDLF